MVLPQCSLTLLHKVIENAAGANYNNLTDEWLENQIGMNGMWRPVGQNNVYFSTARDAARFGLLNLARGSWNDNRLYSEVYVNQMTHSSQNINPSYGFLWWLNGKEAVIFPESTVSFPSNITPEAPVDMISALGKNGQFIDIIPSRNLLVVRMWDSSDLQPIPSIFHNEMWQKINTIH